MPRISELPALAQATSGDLIPIVDDSGNITKKVTANKVVPDGSVVATQLASNSVTTAKIGDGQVTAGKIDFSTFNLGYVERTTNITATSTPSTVLSISVTVPSGVSYVYLKAHVPKFSNNNNAQVLFRLLDGSTTIIEAQQTVQTNYVYSVTILKRFPVSAGTYTFNLDVRNDNNTVTVSGSSTVTPTLSVGLFN